MTMLTRASMAFLVTLLVGSVLCNAAPKEEAADRLILQLGSARFAEREAASRELESIGEAALEALRKAARQGIDPETRRRAAQLVGLIEGKRLCREFLFEHPDQPSAGAIVVAPSGHRALVGMSYGNLVEWNLENGKESRRFQDGDTILGIDVSPNGRHLLSAHVGGEVRLWDIGTGKVLQRYYKVRKGSFDPSIKRVKFFPDGRRALGAADDASLRVWALESGKELSRLEKHRGAIESVALSPDGRRALSGSDDDGTMRLWDLESGRELREFEGHTGGVAFSPDGKLGISGGEATLRLWDLDTGRLVRELGKFGDIVSCVAYSPDGKRVLAGCAGGTLWLWDVAADKEPCQLKGHRHCIRSVTFLPNSRQALSGGDDRIVRLWNLPNQ